METTATSPAHTPGPWYTAFDIDSLMCDVRAVRFGTVATVGDGKDRLDAEQVANARLIAAAPQLLAALEELLDKTFDGDFNVGFEMDDREAAVWEVACAAIAKAYGTTH